MMQNMETIKSKAYIAKKNGKIEKAFENNRNSKRILVYHNILPEKYYENKFQFMFTVSAENFYKHLEVIKKYFDVDLDINNPNTITITFDDGYENQFIYGSRILKKYNALAYFFITLDLLNNNKLYCDLIYRSILYSNKKISIPEFKETYLLVEGKEKLRLWKDIFKKINAKKDFIYYYELLRKIYDYDIINKEFDILRFSGMKRQEINALTIEGHKIGWHSKRHFKLFGLDKYELVNEARRDNEWGINTNVFSYPFGDRNCDTELIKNVMKENNFRYGLSYTNDNGKWNDLFIPRFDIPNTSDETIIEYYLSGAYYYDLYGRGLPEVNDVYGK